MRTLPPPSNTLSTLDWPAMNRQDFRFFHRLRVRWAEVDMQKIVFNAHYLMYFDTAIADYWRALALPYEAAMQQLQGEERGLEFRHLVEEPGLIGEPHGRRFVEAAGAQQLQIGRIQFFKSLPEPGYTISQIGTERKPGRLQKSSGWRSTPPKRRGTLK